MIFVKAGILRKFRVWYLLLLVFVASCGGGKRPVDHPEIMTPAVHSAEIICDSVGPVASMAYLDSVFYTIPNPGVGDQVIRFQHIRTCMHRLDNNYDTNMLYIDSLILILKDPENKEEYPLALMNTYLSKGDAYFSLKQFDDAYLYYFKANLLAEKIDPSFLSHLYSARLGTAFFRQAKYHSSLMCYQRAFEGANKSVASTEKERFFKFSEIQNYLNNIGLCYERLEQYDSAVLYYKIALHAIDEFEKSSSKKRRLVGVSRAVVYGNLGGTYLVLGKLEEAEHFLRKSIEINTQKGYDNKDAQTAQAKLAQLLINTKRTDEARTTLDELKLSLDSLPNIERQLRWLELNWNYYELNGDTEMAYQFIKQLWALRKEADINKQKQAGLDVNKQFENIERQFKVELLTNENELQSTYIWLGVLVSVGGIIISLLMLLNWRQSRRNIVTLTGLNAQINTQNNELANTNKEKDRMMKALVHDLRNPMAGIHSLSSIMLDDSSHSEENSEMLQLIHKASLYSTEMIRDLVEATLNDPKENLKKTQTDMHLLVKQCVNILQFKAAEKNQQIVLTSNGQLWANIDAEKIHRAVNNLITNAIKFSHAGTTINISLKQSANNIQLKVEDSGVGIPKELHSKVFDLFTEAKRMGTANEKPFGLGMSISKQIIEAHNGKIWFESEMGKGTTFYVEFPLD